MNQVMREKFFSKLVSTCDSAPIIGKLCGKDAPQISYMTQRRRTMNTNQMGTGSLTAADHLKSDIEELVPDMVAFRRDLHKHPELAFEEVRTSGLVAQRLHSLGLEVQVGVAQTGVAGLLRGGASQLGAKTIAIRADMDALPIHEVTELDYRSTVDGKMHACGHDGHTAILLSVAALLSKRRAELTGNVKLLFQPAEEGRGGANLMLQEGVMEGVDGVLGLHLMSTSPVGRVGVRAGAVFASADGFVLRVKGKGGTRPCRRRQLTPSSSQPTSSPRCKRS